ncbi:MAG: histidine phosphatase family protein [Methylotenera sp.]|nr:histidine phosphatase family protein [Methylotenera sp.]
MANLILWRHADAEPDSASGLDSDRVLSKQGRKDATRMAAWLDQFLPSNTTILCSPARRCLETVAALPQLNNAKLKRQVQVVDFLAADRSVEQMLQRLVNDDHQQTFLVVGHQPNLGLVISQLLGMQSACVVKKGAIWWLRQRALANENGLAMQTYLFAVQQPTY